MATISPQQIAAYAQQAGFRGNSVTIAVAIALAESGGNTTAMHVNTNGSTDYGLWQINSVHSQYNGQLLLTNPLYNAQAAYAISSGGSNWNPWTTYQTGAYKQYMNALGSGGVNTGPTNIQPWYTFPRVDNIGAPDPYGGFPKPDSNIQLPAGYPVTSLFAGTVSGTDVTSPWGASVTIQLAQPLNSLATHTAYLHLRGDLQVRVGQQIAAGQLIAYNGSSQAAGSQKVPLGFALYPGPNYGQGSAWSLMTTANLLTLLNPVPVLDAAKNGKLGNISGGFYSGFGIPSFGNLSYTDVLQKYTPLSSYVHTTLTSQPGFYGIALAIDEAEQFPGWIDLTDPNNPGPLPDFVGLLRSVGATITDNATPFAIRSGLVLCGVVLLFACIMKPVTSAADSVGRVVEATS